MSCDQSPGLHVSEDTLVMECVNAAGDPVDDGSATKVLLTNLHSRTFPMIRYELEDGVRLMQERCPAEARIA